MGIRGNIHFSLLPPNLEEIDVGLSGFIFLCFFPFDGLLILQFFLEQNKTKIVRFQ